MSWNFCVNNIHSLYTSFSKLSDNKSWSPKLLNSVFRVRVAWKTRTTSLAKDTTDSQTQTVIRRKQTVTTDRISITTFTLYREGQKK